MTSNPTRKRAPATPATIWSFVEEALVVCPRCTNAAVVRVDAERTHARLTCSHCGLARTKPAQQSTVGDPKDPYFRIPLWLQTSFRRHTLWAYNRHHLEFLRRFAEAVDRQRPLRKRDEALNRLLTSRLPRWMTAGKNRDEVLAELDAIERKLRE